MINANELRIGNLFYKIDRSNTVHLPIEIPLKVLEINMFNVSACLADENPAMMKTIPVISISDLSPIPLTPEVLEKCRFVQVRGNIFYRFFDYNEFRVFIHKETDSVFMHYKGNTVNDSVNNLPLHRLQNIIHALTNEELTYDSTE